MKLITPTILILIALGVFFGYVDGKYEEVQVLQAEEARLDDALKQARSLLALRDALLEEYNQVPEEDIERLNKLLPDHIDNVRLILDIDNIASQYGLDIEGFSFAQDSQSPSQGGPSQNQPSLGPDTSNVGVATFSFNVETTYSVLKQFLTDLEESLRIVDVVSLGFSSSELGLNSYNITLRTYWLR